MIMVGRLDWVSEGSSTPSLRTVCARVKGDKEATQAEKMVI